MNNSIDYCLVYPIISLNHIEICNFHFQIEEVVLTYKQDSGDLLFWEASDLIIIESDEWTHDYSVRGVNGDGIEVL